MSGSWSGTGIPLAVRVRELSVQAWNISGILHIPDMFPVAFDGKLLPHHSEHALENVISIEKGKAS